MVFPTSGMKEAGVQRGDVLTHIDGTPLANDGTVPFNAGGGRISFSYLVSKRCLCTRAHVFFARTAPCPLATFRLPGNKSRADEQVRR